MIMRPGLFLLGAAAFVLSSAGDAQVQGVCVSGCYIPNPQQQQQQRPPDLTHVFHFQAVQESNDFWLRESSRPDPLPALSQVNLPIRDATSLVTGPAGSAKFTLDDGTNVSLGPGTQLAIDRFEKTSDDAPAKVSMHLVKGKLRWTNKLEKAYHRIFPELRIISGLGSVRGTDFEVFQDVDGSGYVQVYEGVFTYTDDDSGSVLNVNPGQTLRFENFKVVGIE
jgi:hypothetical protein